MSNQYKTRLLELADFLDKLPPHRFDFQHIVGKDWEGRPDLSCGTTACALGWATTIPSIAQAGLTLDLFPGHGQGYVYLNHDRNKSFDTATRVVFDLNLLESRILFVPYYDPEDDQYDDEDDLYEHMGAVKLAANATAKEVGENIRNFVRTKYPED